jgi:hypothetical protein
LISAEGEIGEKIRYHDIYKTCFLISVLRAWGAALRQPFPPGCVPEGKYWIHNVSRASEEEGEFHIQFGRLKNEGEMTI